MWVSGNSGKGLRSQVLEETLKKRVLENGDSSSAQLMAQTGFLQPKEFI